MSFTESQLQRMTKSELLGVIKQYKNYSGPLRTYAFMDDESDVILLQEAFSPNEAFQKLLSSGQLDELFDGWTEEWDISVYQHTGLKCMGDLSPTWKLVPAQ